MQGVVVESVLWEGRRGGAIFNGVTSSGRRYRIVAGPRVMPRPPLPGETWDIEGKLRRHPEYGEQVESRSALLRTPSGRLLIDAISGSKLFPGIGKARARALWWHFGESIYTLLAAGEPDPFIELLGVELAGVLVRGWREVEGESSLYRWLDRHGLPCWLSRKLIAIYGSEAVRNLEENPYRLLAFTTWSQAEKVARAVGIPEDDARRLVAAADTVCYRRLSQNHTFTTRELFCGELLHRVGRDRVERALKLALEAFAVVPVGDGLQGIAPYSMEMFIARRVREMLAGKFQARQMTLRLEASGPLLETVFQRFRKETLIALNEAQRQAVKLAVTAPFGCITGGAGVGKTTVLRAIHEATREFGFSTVCQMAFTGRAAKRMTEATRRPALTIAAFLRGVDSGLIKLEGDALLLVDEASMLDLPHCYRIMRRMPPGTRLLLIGDSAQLPPIGFGLTFHTLAGHPEVPTVELTEVHRQAAETGIPAAGDAVRRGSKPVLTAYYGRCDGVSFIDASLGQLHEKLKAVVKELGGTSCCQVISPVKNGEGGTRAINGMFHGRVPAGQPRLHGFAVGEPVIWTENDYQRGLLNGTLGTVVSAGESLEVEFEDVLHTLEAEDVDDMDHAYAITVHKSQGSQFERVVIPVFPSRLLDRTLLYTAITRAEKQVVLIGDRAAFEEAIAALPAPSLRCTGIALHLDGCLSAADKLI